MAFEVDNRVLHPIFGLGTVTSVDSEGRVEVRFDQAGQKWLALKQVSLRIIGPEEEARLMADNELGQEESFAPPDEEGAHGHGDHWGIFAEDTGTLIGTTLPTAIQQGRLACCWAENRVAPYQLPPDTPGARHVMWPSNNQGMMVVMQLADKGGPHIVVSAYPWVAEGVQHAIVLERVLPWHNQLEAQIEADLNGMPITFFDGLYGQNRGFYRSGKRYQFILFGFAYICEVITPQPMVVSDPETVRIFRSAPGEDPEDISPITLQTKGLAAFFPCSKGDRDDYQFQAPVKDIKETEMLGQRLWRIRATVGRSLNDEDLDLAIFVTEKALRGDKVPQPGDDIAGALWLQGYLWYPEPLPQGPETADTA
jgi:hypothetical protein